MKFRNILVYSNAGLLLVTGYKTKEKEGNFLLLRLRSLPRLLDLFNDTVGNATPGRLHFLPSGRYRSTTSLRWVDTMLSLIREFTYNVKLTAKP